MKKQRKIEKKRRIECKTDYKKRLNLLKSKYLRFVVRKTNRYMILQIVKSLHAQDKVIYSLNTKELLTLGWPEKNKNSLKSIPAAYLGGLLLGKKATGLKEILILDKGLIPNTKGSRIYAAVKGLSDSKINIKYDEKAMPTREKILGENTKIKKQDIEKIIEKINEKAKPENKKNADKEK